MPERRKASTSASVSTHSAMMRLFVIVAK